MHSTHHMRYFVIQIFLLYFELENSDGLAMTVAWEIIENQVIFEFCCSKIEKNIR